MSDLKISRKDGGLISLGDDQFRIQQGPKLKVGTATPELLHNDATASYYQMNGPDAFGYPIEAGKPFEYLDWGGHKTEGQSTFYIHERFPVDASEPKLPGGQPNPYFVPEHDRKAPETSPDNRTFFTYVFVEMGTRETEEAAIEFANLLTGKTRSDKPNHFPKSHLDHLEKANASPRMQFKTS